MISDTLINAASSILGTGIGAYFGFKGSLNGMKAAVHETKTIVGDIRDTTLATQEALKHLPAEVAAVVRT